MNINILQRIKLRLLFLSACILLTLSFTDVWAQTNFPAFPPQHATAAMDRDQMHSRYGKATLVTMGYEPRIAIGFPGDAGSPGTKMNRRHWGQDLENSTSASEYHWMAGTFFPRADHFRYRSFIPA